MISYILESVFNTIKSRVFILGVILFGMFCVLASRIFELQIVNEDYYLNKYVMKAVKERYISSTRGNILDSEGNLLAYNKLAYAITIEDVLETGSERPEKLNHIIYTAVNIIESNGDSITNNFSIILNKNDQLEFSAASDAAKTRFLKDVYGDNKYIEDPDAYETSSASEVLDFIIDKYAIDKEKYELKDIVKIGMTRHNLSKNAYQKYVSTKLASNVSDETVAAIYEGADILQGVSVAEETIRVYNDSRYFAPIIGYTSMISDTQLADYVAGGKDYISTDIVGKAGIEQSMEEYLQGTKGYEEFFADSTGRILDIIQQREASAGNDVKLTIDRKTQIATYKVLEQKIAGVLISKIQNKVKAEPSNTDDEKDEKIFVPVKDVYYQLINNNIIDVSNLNRKKASTTEKQIYDKYSGRRKNVLKEFKKLIKDENSVPIKDLSDEYSEYSYYIYDKLIDSNILIKSKVDTADNYYKDFWSGDINCYEFIKYAISKNWINVSKLEVSDDYTTADDIFDALVDQTLELLTEDKGFAKKIYYYMIYDNTLTGSEICIVLYDQKVLKRDEKWYNKLLSYDSHIAYTFIIEQIRDLKITPAQIALDPCSGSVVLTDPNNGNVISMVTYPSYDNNMLSGTVDAEYWAKLTEDTSNPLYNRATQTTLAPGSTFKMVSASAGLEENVISTAETIKCTGEYKEITPHAKCWIYPGAHGATHVTRALGVSCNFFFYEVGYRLGTMSDGSFSNDVGLAKLKKYADEFGLTTKSGVEIPENEPNFSTESVVRSAIGQGNHAFNGVQLARYISTIGNGGSNYALTLIDKVADKSGITVYEQLPKLENKVEMKDSTWNVLHNGLSAVTKQGGTVYSIFKDLDIDVSGKTGTAEENKKRFSHSLFVAYAPTDDPQYGISVVIPFASESAYAAEVARDVIKYKYNLLTDKEINSHGASDTQSGITND